ncbi:MAG: hypothetical protein ACK49R_00735, partial [Planctomycetota bacterium]
SAASNYFVKRRDRVENPWKTVTYSHYPKLAIVCRTDDHFILAFASRRGPKPDVDEFKELEEIKGVRPLCLALGGNEPAGGRVGGWLSPI